MDTIATCRLNPKEEVAKFLGVHIKQDQTAGKVTLTQRGRTDCIIEALGCKVLPCVDAPADEVLGEDKNGEPPQCAFNCASVIGMLWCLCGHSRPNLGFAVSQTACFLFNPKQSHELALICIGQCLKKTRDKGMILQPMSSTSSFVMDAHVDSDFMSLCRPKGAN